MNNFDTQVDDKKLAIGVLALGPATCPALTTLKASPLLHSIPFSACAMSERPYLAEWPKETWLLTAAGASQFQAWNQDLDVLLVMLDESDGSAQQAYQSFLGYPFNPETMILILPFNQNGDWLGYLASPNPKKPQASQLPRYWYAPAAHGPETLPTAFGWAAGDQMLPLMVFNLLSPFFYPGIVGVEFYCLTDALPAGGLVESSYAVAAGRDRAKTLSDLLLVAWQQSESQYPENPTQGVFINVMHGPQFDITELDQAAAILLLAMPELIVCSISETCLPALGDAMCIGVMVGRSPDKSSASVLSNKLTRCLALLEDSWGGM